MQTEAEIIPFDKRAEKEPVCSFCKTPKSKAKQMFKGNVSEKHVCGDCIVKCKALLGS